MVAQRTYGLTDEEFRKMYASPSKPSIQVYNISVDGMRVIEDRRWEVYEPATKRDIEQAFGVTDLEEQILIYLFVRKNVPFENLKQFVDSRAMLKLSNTLKQMEAKGLIFTGGYYSSY